MHSALIIMARFPVPGKVKTRLGASIGSEQAAGFYRLCSRHICDEMRKLSRRIRRYVFFTDTDDEFAIREWLGSGFILRPQIGDGLGERLMNAFKEVFTEKAERTVAIASDTPDITADIVKEGLKALESADVVIGPSHDGGYYAIGMKRLERALFQDIDWGSEGVYRQTVSRARATGLTAHILPTLIDIDTLNDLRMWLKTPGAEKSSLQDFVRSQISEAADQVNANKA